MGVIAKNVGEDVRMGIPSSTLHVFHTKADMFPKEVIWNNLKRAAKKPVNKKQLRKVEEHSVDAVKTAHYEEIGPDAMNEDSLSQSGMGLCGGACRRVCRFLREL